MALYKFVFNFNYVSSFTLYLPHCLYISTGECPMSVAVKYPGRLCQIEFIRGNVSAGSVPSTFIKRGSRHNLTAYKSVWFQRTLLPTLHNCDFLWICWTSRGLSLSRWLFLW